MKKKRTVTLLVGVLGLLLGRDAQAFYNPSTGRWLSRDPLGEVGFARATEQSAGAKAEVPSYLFANNSPMNTTDILGLDVVVPGYTWMLFKQCGSIVARAIGPDNGIWIDACSRLFVPHVFVILADGTRLTHGGDTEGEGHWTAKTSGIYIPRCASCQRFTQCVKENWPDSSTYDTWTNNCGQAALRTIVKCGGIPSLTFMWPTWY